MLEVDQRPRAPQSPRVCVAETATQLGADTPDPRPLQQGRAARSDSEYQRPGTAHLCMVLAPRAGRRAVQVTDRRTAVD
jgi:hypothetical protein